MRSPPLAYPPGDGSRMSTEQFDYIIIGAGSAGCVLAHRLTEDPATQVLLLEAGGSDNSIFIQMPSALSIPMNKARYNWFYWSDPEPALDNRQLHCPRGKVLGGSSSINGMAYVRGNALDYETWAELGANGWSYQEVLPYFRRAENFGGGGDDYRGDSGPLHTSPGRMDNPLYRAFVAAGVEAGYPHTEDMNGYQQEGFGRMDMTVYQGRRWSTANAYIRPIRQRRNLTLRLHALTDKILIEDGRAHGVTYQRGEQRHTVRARREIILAGGPVNSPQLLMLSGIGPGHQLTEHGIPLVADLAGVGENLMDHLELYVQCACRQPISLYSALNPLAKARIGARWLLRHDGLGGTNHFESGGFIRSRPGVRWPDIQYHFLPVAMSYDGNSTADGHGFQAHVGPMRSRSRGWVRLASNNPHDKPRVFFNYMSHEDDWIEMRASIRLTREIFAQPALDALRGEELAPGPHAQSDAELDAFVKATVESAYHPSGTCRMGASGDPRAVVDPECRVNGVDGLRVVDSSIMPQITTGNLNAPTIMLAEKAADMIRGRQPLAPSSAPFYVAEQWQTRQRPGVPRRPLPKSKTESTAGEAA